MVHTVVTFRRLNITVVRAWSGFNFSLIYRGPDEYEEKDTGLFVARVIPGGQAQRFGVRQDDKILMINDQSPKSVEDAVVMIRKAGLQIKLLIVREVGGEYSPPSHLTDREKYGTSGSSKGSIGSSWGSHGVETGSTSPVATSLIKQNPAATDPTLLQGWEGRKDANDSGYYGSTVSPNTQWKNPGIEDEVNRQYAQIKQDLAETGPILSQGSEPFAQWKNTGIGNEEMQNFTTLQSPDLGASPIPEMPEGNRLTRKEEKSTLQNLNNRLAGYICRVRALQSENSKLCHQVNTVEEGKRAEITNLKDLYDKQIEKLKNALDDMNKYYNQQKYGAEVLLQENEDLKHKVTKKDTELSDSKRYWTQRANALEDELKNLGNQLTRAEYEHTRTQDQLRAMPPELESLRDLLGDVKTALGKEKLKSADLENKCAQLEESFNFKMSVKEKELVEEIQKQKVVVYEGVDEDYENRLQKELQKLRDIYDDKMRQKTEDFEKRYEDRIRELQSQLIRERDSNDVSKQELRQSRARIEALVNKVSDLEGANLTLNKKIADMSHQIEDQQLQYRAQLAAKDGKIQQLLDELENKVKEYQNLHEIKIALDIEIAYFRRLIESEEDRLRNYAGNSGGRRTKVVTVEKTTTSLLERKTTL